MKLSPLHLAFCFGIFAAVTPPALGFKEPDHAQLRNLDVRKAAAPQKTLLAGERAAAAVRLRDRLPQVKVELDEIRQSPKFIAASDRFLSGPNGEGGTISELAAGEFAVDDPHRAAKAFLKEHRALFGHGPEVLAMARVKREFVSPHNGLRTVVWEQQLDDIAVFEGVLIAHTTKAGELVNLCSLFVPDAPQAANRGVPNRAALQAAPAITAALAIAKAAQNIGEKVEGDQVVSLAEAAAGGEKRQPFKAPGLPGATEAQLVWLPMNPDTLRLCWDVILTSGSRGEMFRVLVDVETGEVLVRHCLTAYLSDASFRVFTSDSPSPFSPGHPTPLTNQPPLVPRQLITWPALNATASPNGWINDSDNETRGNNVDAHLDRNNDNQPDLPRPQGSPNRVFDFPMDLNQHPTNYSPATVAQLFYSCNWMHDRLYEMGFTEAAGNFQNNNFGRGGLGNDALQADAQDGGGYNNANMSTPPDGSPPRMQMYLFNGPTPFRDGDLDAEIVLHEYTHGLSNRRVGGGVGISQLQSAGLGEGWSDFYPMTLFSESGDDVDGCYASGGYATYMLGGLLENYYFGIRRYPYSTDMTKNPLTFKDIDPGQASAHDGISRSPIIGNSASEVHNQGEVWCVTLWDARANLIKKHGYAVGNRLILQLVTDGMNLSPANPNFLQGRDAIIQADLVNNGGANRRELWAAFAKRGMGFTATSPASSTTSGVEESYDLPDDLSIIPLKGFTANGPVGGPFSPVAQSFVLTNTGSNTITWTVGQSEPWMNVAPTGGTLIPGGPSTTVSVSLDGIVSSLPEGVYNDTIGFTNLASGVSQVRRFQLRIGQPDYFTELFAASDNDLDNLSFTFTPDGSSSFYSVCRRGATSFPTDPTGGTSLSLGDDNYTQVTLSGTNTVSIYGKRANTFFVGSNGYLTWDQGDSSLGESLDTHFALPRISALFDDLYPGSGGTVSWKQLSDRVAVTFSEVPEFGSSSRINSFQFELFFDGTIRLTYLRIDATDGLAGLSQGLGVPTGFVESDFSSYGGCFPPLTLRLPESANEDDGLLTGQGQVRLPVPLATNLVVHLASSDASEVTVPSTVTLPAGATEVAFDLAIQDDAKLDGTRTPAITASAAGFASATRLMAVFDNEPAHLTVSLPASATEGDPPLPGVVSVSPAPDES